MKIPDGNKPIQIGDPSFIYKGVYHPITWIGKEPYRPRVEMLVIKDARYVFLRLKDDIENTPPDKRNHRYSIPGGSLDADSTRLEQAIAETNEEALVNVTLVYHSGISYYDRYEPGFILKGGDMPLEYIGSISDVFIGIYDGPYDKSKIEEKDLDDDMANNGKFYEITKIGKYLRREHIDALIRSQFIADDIKAALQIYRTDAVNESTESNSPIIVPDGKLYHGSVYEIDKFKPMSLDLGNAFQEPGWSTFCFGEYDHAKIFGAARAFTNMLKDANYHDAGDEGIPDDENGVVFVNGYLVMSKQCFEFAREYHLLDRKVKFYVYTIDADKVTVGLGNDPALKEYTFRDSDVPFETRDTFEVSMMDIKELIEVTDKSIKELVQSKYNEYSDYLTHDYQKEKEIRDRLEDARVNGDIQPGDNIQDYMDKHNLSFDSDDVHLPDISVDIDEPVFESGNLGDLSRAIMEEKYPKDVYGLPERKAYPMPDEKHVRSAIKFFNYAKKEEEKELATNINKKIRKFKIKDINVGKKNRFRNYYQPVTDAYSFADYMKTIEKTLGESLKIVSDESIPPQKRYESYEKSANVCRMFVTQVSAGIFDNEFKDEDEKNKFIESNYACLAEIAMNQVELLSTMEASDIRTLNLNPVMEADDDEDEDDVETATDYTAMADEAGAEGDGNDGDTEPDEATSGEGATDYTAMADEAGAEDDEPDTTEEESNEDTGDDNDEDETGTEGEEDTSDNDGDSDTEPDDTEDEPTEDPVEEPTDDESSNDADESGGDNTEDEATDYTAMADEAGAEGTEEDESGEGTDDYSSGDIDTSTDDSGMSEEGSDTNDNSENDKRYNNKEVKNYFLLNSYLSMHQIVVDVLDTVNGVVLPTPDANAIMGQVVKNLQSVKAFIEKFIQFQFSDTDYAFNLYYYNILMNALRMNLKLLETAVAVGGEDAKIKNKKEE